MKSIQIEWAILSKFPDDAKDYRILASSAGGLDAQSYHLLMRRWLVGEVPFSASSYNPAAPWYQFGVEKDPARQVILRQEWEKYTDYSRRPVLTTTCLLLPFEELVRTGCGFQQMVGLFEQDGVKTFLAQRALEISMAQERLDLERLEIVLPDLDGTLAWMKEVVEKIGFGACVQTANNLLDRAVGLLQPSGEISPWQERLKWLDAVLAVLPYGLRADCPACLWVSGGTEHTMRLYWARSARQGHAGLLPDRMDPDARPQNPQDYVEDLIMLRERMSLEQILSHLAKQATPLYFTNPLPRNLLYDLGMVFVVMNRIRREKKDHLTLETLREVDSILGTNGLDMLTEAERNELILGILSDMRLSQIKLVWNYWNDDLTKSTLEFIVKSFQNPATELASLQASALLIMLTGEGEKLFHRLWEYHKNTKLEDQTRSRMLFLGLLHNTLQDGMQVTESGRQLVDQLRQWAVANSLSVDDLYFWAQWIAIEVDPISEDRQRISYQPLLDVIQEFSGPDSWSLRALKIALGIVSEPFADFPSSDVWDLTCLATLLSTSIRRGTIQNVFSGLANILISFLTAKQESSIDSILKQPLSDISLTHHVLSTRECALLDELHLIVDTNTLSMPALLPINTDQFEVYLIELKGFLESLPKSRLDKLCDRLHRLLMTVPIPNGSNSAANLQALGQIMQDLTQDQNGQWRQLAFIRYQATIRAAVENESSPEELALVCQPVLLFDLQVQRNLPPSNWVWLVDQLSRCNYPNKAEDLWQFASLLDNFLVQHNGDGAMLAGLFHRAVIIDGKFLMKLEEREKYVYQVNQKMAHHLDLLKDTAVSMNKFHEGRSWLGYLKGLIRRLYDDLLR